MRAMALALLIGMMAFCAGCGGDSVPEDAPPTPEPGTDDYDQYNNAGRGGPGQAPGNE